MEKASVSAGFFVCAGSGDFVSSAWIPACAHCCPE
jgi:hypothetical protein